MRLSERQRRSLHLALASARNELARLHQKFAAERLAALPDEPPARVLREYGRAHGLGRPEAESLSNRVIASFGAAHAMKPQIRPLVPPPANLPPTGRLRGWLNRLLRRRPPALREWLTLHTAHTEAVLLGAHAMHVIQLLESVEGGIADVPAIIDFYLRETRTRGALREPITVIALDRLYRLRSPGRGSATRSARASSQPNHVPRAAVG